MRVNQQWIDVLGNNLANSNTPGYKSTRASFSTALSQTLQYASGPNGNVGGRNSDQIGLGAGQVSTNRSFNQGALTQTGRIFDLALEGSGFFSLLGNGQRSFSRVGTFGLDASQNLVDQNTGFQVLNRSGEPIILDTESLFPPQATTTVEIKGNLPAAVDGPLTEVLTSQNPFSSGTTAQLTSTNPGPVWSPGIALAGQAYNMEVVVSGGIAQQVSVIVDPAGDVGIAAVVAGLDAIDGVSANQVGNNIAVTSDRTGEAATIKVLPGPPNDLAGLIGMPTSITAGVNQPAVGTTSLNTMTSTITQYAPGDQLEITGVASDGSPVNAVFTFGAGNDGTTLDDLEAFMDGIFIDADVGIVNGSIIVTAQDPGESDLLLSIADAPGNSGSAEWSTHFPTVTTEGTPPDEVVISTEVFDNAGVAHTLTLTFQRAPDMSWSVIASMPSDEGSVLVGGELDPLTGIRFNTDGTPTGLGAAETQMLLRFNGQNLTHEVNLDFGQDGGFEGITQFGSSKSLTVGFQDGYSDGELANLSIDTSGAINGFYTNGQLKELAQLGIATFTNEDGLSDAGNNFYTETGNTGAVSIGEGGTVGRGVIVSGALENSNVDTAETFVRLIEAQRGFQANARIITTQDEILAEVVNLI
jgi:flagellar hook protein FlgE